MKNEWSYSPCQYRSSAGLSDAASAAAVLSSPPAAHSYSSMGHQPSGQHYYHHHHHHHYPPRGGTGAVGGNDSHPIDLRCSCACTHMPEHRTILHGILTGRGYKFGYGTAFEPHFFPHNFDQEDFFMGLQAIEPKYVLYRCGGTYSRFLKQFSLYYCCIIRHNDEWHNYKWCMLKSINRS